jgi:hypothetical protein
MTKGRAVLPGRIVAEQELFFIILGGPVAPDPPLRVAIPAAAHFAEDPEADVS